MSTNELRVLHTVNKRGQLALEIKLTCEILEEKYAKVGNVAMAMVDVASEIGRGECATTARRLNVWVYCRNNAAVALFILIRAVFFSWKPWLCEGFFFFFWGLWERPWEGDGGLLGRIKGGQGLAFTGLPTCSSSPGALVQLGGSDAGLPALGMEGVQGKMCKIIWDKTRWLVLTNELMNMKWKTVTENEY